MEPSEIGLLSEGRIEMSDAEHTAVDALQEKHQGENLSLTRDENGKLLVTAAGEEVTI